MSINFITEQNLSKNEQQFRKKKLQKRQLDHIRVQKY